MGRQKYNSAADRRWQQRYERIRARKEDVFDVETPREERRREKKTLYKAENIDIKRMVPNKVAVLCTSPKQIRQLYWAVEKWNPEYTKWQSASGIESTFYFCNEPTVGIIEEHGPLFEVNDIRIDTKRYFIAKGFEVIDFYELLPVRDLGKVRAEPEMVGFLLGI